MKQRIWFVLTLLFTGVLVAILNGNINIPANPLPPLGKFLDPFQGAWQSNTSNEKGSKTIPTSGLKAPGSVYYDDKRVPHIFAENTPDALFVQGYVEAQNRLFQMEFLAKVASGELSSMFGERTLSIDLERRRRGMRYAAENAVKGWEKQPSYDRVLSYIAGINAYISQLKPKDYPLEFKLLNIEPTAWTPLKSALIFKQMTFTLNGMTEDVKYTNMYHVLGADMFADLFPEKETIENPVIPMEQAYTKLANILTPPDNYQSIIYKDFYETRPRGVGSNSWGVGGSKTKTGKPIFCNDPHLALALPSIWIEEHIRTPEFNAYGVSFPGFPGIMIGFNDHIAWGETNVGQEVIDMHHIQWKDATRSAYILDGKEMKPTQRIETIYVKGQEPIIDTVLYTHWGPVYSKSKDCKTDLAMRWIAHDTPETPEFNTFVDALSARNYSDYIKATEPYLSPAQNFGAADNSGNIGVRVNGVFPVKGPGDGLFVKKGDKAAYGWQSYIPKAQNPQIINPRRGFVATANQVSADKSYPYYFNGKFEHYRNATINGILARDTTFTIDDMKAMQFNDYSIKADRFVNTLRSMITDPSTLSPGAKKWFDKMMAWDYRYTAKSEEATYFELWYELMEKNTWDEIFALSDTMDIRVPEDWRLMELMKDKPMHAMFDDKRTSTTTEKALDIAIKSLDDASRKIDSLQAAKSDISWAGYKPLNIYHLMRLPALSAMDIKASGCVDAINATGVSYGPSWRMVVSLEDKVKGYGVYPGGQSGNVASRYYKNYIDTWTKGKYNDLNNSSTAEAYQKAATQTLKFTPAK